jgi:sulfur carrier protein
VTITNGNQWPVITGAQLVYRYNMKITLNGNVREINSGATVKALLDSIKLNPEAVAVELNLAIIPKNEYDTRRLNEADKIEIISFVGGG